MCLPCFMAERCLRAFHSPQIHFLFLRTVELSSIRPLISAAKKPGLCPGFAILYIPCCLELWLYCALELICNEFLDLVSLNCCYESLGLLCIFVA